MLTAISPTPLAVVIPSWRPLTLTATSPFGVKPVPEMAIFSPGP